jgi:hypothetical protein
MSQSLASAKKRRAPAAPSLAEQQMQQQQSSQQSMANSNLLTLPQVIQIVDKRLTVLEKFMNDSTATIQLNDTSVSGESKEVVDIPSNFKEIIDEFDKRYELLAEEIVNIKNIVLSLQSYTMEVNKTLMEERVRIFSDLEEAQMETA